MSKLIIPDYLNSLIEKLPDDGPGGSVSLEMARAFNKIAWDLNNNGFGNKWLPAIMFLMACEQKYLDQDSIFQGSLFIYGFGIKTHHYDKLVNDVNNLANTVEKIIHAYEASGEDKYSNVDFWDFRTWRFLIEDEGTDNKLIFTYDFTDVLEGFIDVLNDEDALDQFQELMEQNKEHISGYSSYGSNTDNDLRSFLEESGIDTGTIEWYLRDFKYGLSKNRPLMF